MKNTTKHQNLLPKELIFELIFFIPFNSKWGNTLISKFFNFLIITFQRKWRIYINKLRTSVAQEIKEMVVNLQSIDDPDSHVDVISVASLNNQLGLLFGLLKGIVKHIPSYSDAVKKIIYSKTWSVGEKYKDLDKDNFDTKQEIIVQVLEFIKDKVVGNLGRGELCALYGYIDCLFQGVSEILLYYNRKCAQGM